MQTYHSGLYRVEGASYVFSPVAISSPVGPYWNRIPAVADMATGLCCPTGGGRAGQGRAGQISGMYSILLCRFPRLQHLPAARSLRPLWQVGCRAHPVRADETININGLEGKIALLLVFQKIPYLVVGQTIED
jgi:hypothetical protein